MLLDIDLDNFNISGVLMSVPLKESAWQPAHPQDEWPSFRWKACLVSIDSVLHTDRGLSPFRQRRNLSH